MDGKGLGLLDLHYPHMVQVLCASDHGLCPGVNLGLFDDICVRVLDKLLVIKRRGFEMSIRYPSGMKSGNVGQTSWEEGSGLSE